MIQQQIIPQNRLDCIEKIIREDEVSLKRQFQYYFRTLGFELLPFQLQECIDWYNNTTNLWRWMRGFGKTWLRCHLSVFRAIKEKRTIYLTPFEKQLQQADIYFEQNLFLDKRGRFGKKVDDTYYHHNAPMIITNVLQLGNVASGRFNDIVFDELAIVESNREFIVDKAMDLQQSMDDCKTDYISTPVFGSLFQKKEDFMTSYKKGHVSHRNYINTPNNLVSNTPEKMQRINDAKLEAEVLGKMWEFNQEKLAEYSTRGTTVFVNLVIDDKLSGSWDPTSIGFDFHGGDIGHVAEGVYWTREDPVNLYCVFEDQHPYDNAITAMKSLEYIKDMPKFRNADKYAPSYGFDTGFSKDARYYGVMEKEASDQNVYNALCYVIHINPKLTPKLYADMVAAFYEDQTKYKIHKEKTGDKYRNHFLDAFLLAVPSKGEGFLITPYSMTSQMGGEQYRAAMLKLRDELYQV